MFPSDASIILPVILSVDGWSLGKAAEMKIYHVLLKKKKKNKNFTLKILICLKAEYG